MNKTKMSLHKIIKSNSSSKTNNNFIDDLLKDLEKEKISENKNILFANKNYSTNIDDNKSLKEEDKSYVNDLDKINIDNSNNLMNLTNNSKEKIKHNSFNNDNKQFSKKEPIKEIYLDKNYKYIPKRGNSKKNILNKKNKSIILYPILLKKSTSKLKIKTIPCPNKDKNKNIKKQLNKDKLMKQKEDIEVNEEGKSIFALILNGLPNYNNENINTNFKNPKNCENFNKVKLIDKNLLKLSKKRAFFYKGCKSLLTMNNDCKIKNFIPIIDLLKYDELYEQNFGITKRNYSAMNKSKISLSKIY